mmetsp:Transcript_8182/g.9875  ORF Transcript_8182/g.9875 Transcript_8182/m.9875 type:complete len:289 (+) Transcript_8182:675-1541(+)|eukprot:CAMPEP_0170459746 /NCGR_PEP_ID=MMETSP0123-20130129/6329_1 /TAXON_ID=182087 /ORGANISM="Favella ehrenbergii, Strain Fehren 1" /LENGTH=288 /DNA_ID=CAMNT_0010724429 /DNA_START=637 /DNA_END=1503 /DNA_ORIENTATION=+
MIRTLEHYVHDELFIIHSILWELLGSYPALERHHLFEMVGQVARENHFDDDLSHVPILRLAQQLKHIILRVQKQFECDGAMMVLEDAFVIVTDGFHVAHCDQKGIIDSRVLNIAQQACQEGTHDVQIAEVLHQTALLREVVEVSGQFDDLGKVVIAVLLVCRIFDTVYERDQILIGDGKLVQQAIHLEETEAEMQQEVITEGGAVLENIELPLVKIVHDLQDVGPLARIDFDNLAQALLILLYLILVNFTIVTMELFQKIVKVTLEPLRCVVSLLCGNIKPSFGFHVL